MGLPPGRVAREPVDVLLVDLSLSHDPDAERLLEAALEVFRRPDADRAAARRLFVFGEGLRRLLDHGEEEAVARRRLAALPAGFTEKSDLAGALRGIVGSLPPHEVPRLRLFGDGRYPSTGLAAARAALAAVGGRLEVEGRLVAAPENLALLLAEPPPPLRPEEPATVLVRVEGAVRLPRRVVIAGGIAPVTVALGPGRAALVGIVVRPEAGRERVALRIADAGGPDAHPQDDGVELRVSGGTGPRVGVFGRRAAAIAPRLREGLPGAVVSAAPGAPDPGALADLDAVVLADLPAVGTFGPGVRQALASAVRERGLGLLALGGPGSFRAGGWAGGEGRLEALLPLSSRPPGERTLRVLLDVSGSMEGDDRLGRAVEAVLRLAEAAAPGDRLQVLPFASGALPALPPDPVAPGAFLAVAAPALARLRPRGGTRLLPVLSAVTGLPSVPAPGREVLVLLSDLRDDSLVGPEAVAASRRRIAARKAEVIVVLLDPEPGARAIAEALGGRLVTAARITPELLLEEVQRGGWREEPRAARAVAEPLVPGPLGTVSAWNPTRLAEGAGLLARLVSGEPLAARIRRGAGEVIALATDPLLSPELAAALPALLTATLGRGDPGAAEASREDGVLRVRGPSVPVLRLRPEGGSGEVLELRETTPGEWVLPAGAEVPGGPASLLDAGGDLLGRVVLPPAVAGETTRAASPADALAVAGAPGPGAPRGPRRRTGAALVAAALLATLALRRRPAA